MSDYLDLGRKIVEVASERRFGRNLAPLVPDDMLESLGADMHSIFADLLTAVSEIIAEYQEAS